MTPLNLRIVPLGNEAWTALLAAVISAAESGIRGWTSDMMEAVKRGDGKAMNFLYISQVF